MGLGKTLKLGSKNKRLSKLKPALGAPTVVLRRRPKKKWIKNELKKFAKMTTTDFHVQKVLKSDAAKVTKWCRERGIPRTRMFRFLFRNWEKIHVHNIDKKHIPLQYVISATKLVDEYTKLQIKHRRNQGRITYYKQKLAEAMDKLYGLS